VCNPGTSSAPLAIVAKLVTPTSGATGAVSMNETDTVMLSVLGLGVLAGSFHTKGLHPRSVADHGRPGSGRHGPVPWPPMTINLPGAAGSPVLDFTGRCR